MYGTIVTCAIFIIDEDLITAVSLFNHMGEILKPCSTIAKSIKMIFNPFLHCELDTKNEFTLVMLDFSENKQKYESIQKIKNQFLSKITFLTFFHSNA